MKIKQKHLDMAMRILCERFETNPPSDFVLIEPEYLYSKGLPKKINARNVVDVLESQGYISYKPKSPSNRKSIGINPSGKTYFIAREEEKRKERREHLHDWKIAIFSAVTGALLSDPLWTAIRKVAHLILG